MLQWGLTLPSKETMSVSGECLPITSDTRLQWGLTLPSKETEPSQGGDTYVKYWRSFNGASLFRARKLGVGRINDETRPWKTLLQWGLTLPSKETRQDGRSTMDCTQASMGPHSSEQGNRSMAQIARDKIPGAYSFNGASLFRARKLWIALGFRDENGIASMGPHSSEQGN